MKLQVSMLVVMMSLLSFAASSAIAAGKSMSTQQQRMGECNTQAAGKKGDERKAFMSTCLKKQPAAAPSQQTKMKTCNADAGDKGLKGDERKAFMRRCLSSADGH
jgi:hypothetical protein